MADSLQNPFLARFGRLIVQEVRDATIEQWDRTIESGLAQRDKQAQALLDSLGPAGKDLLHRLIPAIVDTTLHQMMFLFEQGDFHGITISVTGQDGAKCADIADESDGLSGDLVAWIPAFSKERHKPFPGCEILGEESDPDAPRTALNKPP